MFLAWPFLHGLNLIISAFLPCRVSQATKRQSQAIPCMLLPELVQRLRCPDQLYQVNEAVDQTLFIPFH